MTTRTHPIFPLSYRLLVKVVFSSLLINIFFLFTIFFESLCVRSTNNYCPDRPVRRGYQYLYLANHVISSTTKTKLLLVNHMDLCKISSHSLRSNGPIPDHVAIQYRLDDLTDGIKSALMLLQLMLIISNTKPLPSH